MLEYAYAQLPNEACGLLAGTVEGNVRRVQEVCLLANALQSEDRFALDAREQIGAIKQMRERGYRPLGNWHSHPHAPAWPSPEDIRLAYDPDASYLILALGEPDLRAFRIQDQMQVMEEEIIFLD